MDLNRSMPGYLWNLSSNKQDIICFFKISELSSKSLNFNALKNNTLILKVVELSTTHLIAMCMTIANHLICQDLCFERSFCLLHTIEWWLQTWIACSNRNSENCRVQDTLPIYQWYNNMYTRTNEWFSTIRIQSGSWRDQWATEKKNLKNIMKILQVRLRCPRTNYFKY